MTESPRGPTLALDLVEEKAWGILGGLPAAIFLCAEIRLKTRKRIYIGD